VIISRSVLIEMRNVLLKDVEKIRIHILFLFFFLIVPFGDSVKKNL